MCFSYYIQVFSLHTKHANDKFYVHPILVSPLASGTSYMHDIDT